MTRLVLLVEVKAGFSSCELLITAKGSRQRSDLDAENGAMSLPCF